MWKQLSVVTYGMLDALLMFIGIKCIMISILEWLVVIDKWKLWYYPKVYDIGPPEIFHAFASQGEGYLNVGYGKKKMYNEIGIQRRLRGPDDASAIEFLHWLISNHLQMFVKHTKDV